MKRSHYNPAGHDGKQPIRVLKGNLAQEFENSTVRWQPDFFKVMHMLGLPPAISYDQSELPIVDVLDPDGCLVPLATKEDGIIIQESFLSFVWIMCYSHLVIYSEEVEKPNLNRLQGHKYSMDEEATRLAQELFRYGIRLIRTYVKWDINALPNPELVAVEEDYYVTRANGLYTFAISFIMHHELEHLRTGTAVGSSADIVLDELQADCQATYTMLQCAQDGRLKLNYGMGMLLAFCSLLHLQKSVQSPRHPDTDDRIETLLRRLDLDDLSPLWGIAFVSLWM
jgi:hypothetical protein